MPIYTDAQLARLATYERETRATQDVDAIAAFPEFWREKLVTLRTYILICQESLTGGDSDTFRAKLAAYEKEWGATLVLAKDAAAKSGQALAPELPSFSATFGR